MANGVYNINYAGKQGFGSACVVFLNGEIFGTDVVAAEYGGTYAIANGQVTGHVLLTVPAGASLVTGAPISPTPYTIQIPFTMPAQIDEKQVVQISVQLPSGTVNANIKKMKSLAL